MNLEQHAKPPASKTGLFATPARLFRAKGSGAPPLSPRLLPILAIVLIAAAFLPAAAQAEFGLSKFEAPFTDAEGEAVTQAGSHPFEMTTAIEFVAPGGNIEEPVKDVIATLPKGLVGNPTAVTPCPTDEFLVAPTGHCPDASAVGVAAVSLATSGGGGGVTESPIYNLEAPPGTAARLGFWVLGVPVTIKAGVTPTPPYNILAGATNISQALEVPATTITLWGVPADPAHDEERGRCLGAHIKCSANLSPVPFLTMPRSCTGPLRTDYAADSWVHPGSYLPSGLPDLGDSDWLSGFDETADSAGNPLGLSGCGKLGFEPKISAQPTSHAATSPSGLDFSLDAANEGLANPAGVSNADVEKALVTLPQGFSANPALAEGLAVCTEAQLEAESPYSAPGEGPTYTPPGAGCPEASKIGTVEVETPILKDKVLHGQIFIAKPYQNPFGSLLAAYMVIKHPGLGIVVKVPLKVETDPATGQITTLAEDLPPFPFSHFKLHFREGTRSPLVTPTACGTYDGHDAAHEPIRALLTPSSGGAPVKTTSSFEIVSGPDGAPCPTAGLPPFHPALTAGTINNAAGRFSPFNVKLTRSDSEQEFTHFSIKLPPGIAGKLAGIPFCSDAAIAAATARTGPHGGQEELESPSCPAASQVGRTLAGAGVGPSLAYAPGKIYLAGPYHGHPVSLVSVTAGVVGPFDIGTVVVRLALDVNPETGEVFLDSTGSDPLPHIVKGIPVHLRDIRAYTDRPEFTFNPTSCEPSSTSATVLGSGLDFVSPADDNPFVSTSRFQAADCAALPFKPKLTLKLKGQTKRAGNPALSAHLTMAGMGPTGANEAGLAYSRVALPKTLFLDNEHINTICTRVQFREGAVEGEKCPAGSIIGSASASTPILSEPLTGPIYLRSSERELPDLVAALNGSEIHVTAVGHTDSAKGGGLRNTFEVIPDAPISTVDINLFGGKKGLIESSRNLCSYKPKAKVEFKGHNGKHADYPKLAIKATGCKKGKKKSKRHFRRALAERVG